MTSTNPPLIPWAVNHFREYCEQLTQFASNQYTDRTPGCVSQMLINLGWQPLQHRRYLARITMLFKINNGLVEVPEYPLHRADSRTRGTNRFQQIRAPENTYRNSFFHFFPLGGRRGRMVKVADFKSLAPHRCEFEPYSGRKTLHVRKLSSWLAEGRWFYPGSHGVFLHH